MKKGEVIKAFPFAYDGINVEHHAAGSAFPSNGQSISDSTFDGLEKAGYIRTVSVSDVPPEEQLNREIIEAFDRKLSGMSDADLKAVIARSGKPFSGNMVHATLVYAAKQQMLAELNGAEPVRGIDPESGVTEQPRAAPGQATPPSAAAAVEQQKLQQETAQRSNADRIEDAKRADAAKGDDAQRWEDAKREDALAKAAGEVKLHEMTVSELKEYAEANKIDLGEATKKADILEIIEKAKG